MLIHCMIMVVVGWCNAFILARVTDWLLLLNH
jgi:hypothetical protein